MIQMFDWDRLTENDPVATAEIPISRISSAGNEDDSPESTVPSVDAASTSNGAASTSGVDGTEISATVDVASALPALRPTGAGFLPTFGPTFVNFYGAPREFQAINIIDDDLEHLNLGLRSL